MATGMKDLRVWQEAVQLAGEVLRVMRQSTRREIKVFTDSTIELAVSIPGAIAVGYARLESRPHRADLADAQRHLLLLETRLAMARHGGIISASTHATLAARANVVGRLLHGYVSFLDRQAGGDRTLIAPEIADAVSSVVGLGTD